MIAPSPDQNLRPIFDQEIQDIAHYVTTYKIHSQEAYETACLCLMDSLGCAFLALRYPECTKLLGPIVEGATLPQGARVPGTSFQLDPVQAAFNIGTLIRWLDYNDTWLAQEWGHPSDNLGGILAIADYLNRNSLAADQSPLTMKDVLQAMIKAYEIQGVLALENSFNRVGLDHVVLVKIATTAVVMQWLAKDHEQICAALSQAWVDGQSLRTYRHSPNTGSRKSWAAGDATARAVYLALLTLKGEKGHPSALSAKRWGFYDVFLKGQSFRLQRPYGSYVMENILFKISYPAEFHAQTAIECAIQLHHQVIGRLKDITKIIIRTQEPAMRILNKQGTLYNPADRDHSLQYIVAIGLIYGALTADHYEDAIAHDARIDTLREKMHVQEDLSFSRDYLDPKKRTISNAIQIFFQDGNATEEISMQYPIGHRQRRQEGIPLLKQKFHQNLLTRFPQKRVEIIFELFQNISTLEKMPVDEFMRMLVIL